MNREEYLLHGAKDTALRGSALPQSKLTEENVIAIRRNRHGKTAAMLAAEFGVCKGAIDSIRTLRTWSHV
jgi:hypothetical protein